MSPPQEFFSAITPPGCSSCRCFPGSLSTLFAGPWIPGPCPLPGIPFFAFWRSCIPDATHAHINRLIVSPASAGARPHLFSSLWQPLSFWDSLYGKRASFFLSSPPSLHKVGFGRARASSSVAGLLTSPLLLRLQLLSDAANLSSAAGIFQLLRFSVPGPVSSVGPQNLVL